MSGFDGEALRRERRVCLRHPAGDLTHLATERRYRVLELPEPARSVFGVGLRGLGKRGRELRDAWFARVGKYGARYPGLAEQLYRI